MTRMLGRRPPKNAPSLRLAPLLTGVVPAHPVTVDHFSQVNDWGLYQNDRYGVCGPTSVANYIKLVTKYLTGNEVTVTQADVFDLYRRSGNPHFDPNTGADDNGVDMQTMLEALTAGGIGGGHKPVAFAKVDTSNIDEVRAAIAIFGGVLFGVDLEVAQQGQTDAGGPWDYTPSSQWGGHAVVAGLYSSDGAAHHSDIAVVTWAEVIGTTDAFAARQLQEAWVVVFEEHLQHPAFVEGVDLAALSEAYTQLTGRPFPAPGPQPGPTPTPVPPGPAPQPDPADVALARAVGPWAKQRHFGAARHVAAAFVAWEQAKHF